MAQPQPDRANYLINLIAAVELKLASRVRIFLGRKQPTINERNRELRGIKETLKELDEKVPAAAYTLVRHEFENSNQGLPFINRVNVLPVVHDVSAINQEAINLLADNMINRLGDATQTLGRRVDDAFRRHGLRAASAAVVNGGQLPDDFQAVQLKQALENEGLTAFVDRAGRQWNLKTYAEMVVRTTTAEARNRGLIMTVTSRNLDLVKVDHHSHEVDVCSPFDGKTFSLTGAAKGYPILKKIPPFHPNCKHYLMPDKQAFAEREAREAGLEFVPGDPRLEAVSA